ncbi:MULTISPECIES: inner membrane-spanning protein YciB [Thiorhodovibrio]|uniref:inner membrane-spanning protein YciB n=1 Tax=Thiorhodovibrio TaxID=61593 RepID=UPI0019121145|nr:MULTISPECIES: inner membrane-spanning protein YciB [Thiorhodovibrio]MBK5967755.1 septation protein A [Thiorhodovibrio winogradskyi]WPL14440.1 putative intracellular septation protein A [Thiorhodovibrio litoralis]
MKFLADFLPVILFFIAYKLQGIFVATLVAIGAAAVQVGWMRWRHGRIEKTHLITLILLLLFGGLTLALRDPIFVMWKPTIINWLFAGAFLGSFWIGKKPLTERMMGQAVQVPEPIWYRLNWAWVGFFFISGLINLYVIYFGSGFAAAQQELIAASGERQVDLAQCLASYEGELLKLCQAAHASEEIWVNFKLFGMMGLTLAFVIAQAFYLSRHMQHVEGGACPLETQSPANPESDSRPEPQPDTQSGPQATRREQPAPSQVGPE